MARTRSTLLIDAALRSVASDQLGLLTVAQAAVLGIDKHAPARRRATGALVPVFHNVLRLGAVEPTMCQRVLAGALAVPGSVVAATSVAAVHGLPVLGDPERAGDVVLSVADGQVVRQRGLTVVRSSVALPGRWWHGVRLATPGAALLHLPRYVDAGLVERCLDHCLAHRLVTVRSLLELLGRIPPTSISGRALLLGLLADRAPGSGQPGGIGHRSALEQRAGRWLNAAGLTGWRRNHLVEIVGGSPVEVDFAWLVPRSVTLEISPFFTHGSREQQAQDMERRRLLTGAGFAIVEAGDRELASQRAFAPVVDAIADLLGVRALGRW